MTDLEPLQVPIKHAARMLGCCRETLYRMRKDNEITFGRFRGRAMVPMSEIKRVHALLYPQPAAEPDNITQQPVGEPVGEPKKCRPKKVRLFPMVARL